MGINSRESIWKRHSPNHEEQDSKSSLKQLAPCPSFSKANFMPGIVMHAYNPSTKEAEARGL
jgi:hypothetical protein